MHLKDDYLAQNDNAGAGYALLRMAQIQWSQGDYIGTEDTAVKALGYIKKSSDKSNLNSVYGLLGVANRKAFDYENAIANYKEAINCSKDSADINVMRSNIASIYTDMGRYDEALQLLLKIRKSGYLEIDTKARVLNNIGSVYLKLDSSKALGFIQQGLMLREKYNDHKDLVSSYLNLTDYYKQSNRSIAASFAKQAYDSACQAKNDDKKLEALKALVTTTSGSELNEYIEAFIRLNDSLSMNKAKAENKFAKIKYDDEIAKNELKAQQEQAMLQNEKNRLHKLLLAFGIILLLVTGTSILLFIRIRHKRAKVLEVYKTENRISKKIHDELANDVFNVMSFAESRGASPKGQQRLLNDLDSIYQKTRDISRETNTIDTGENFGSMLKDMLADYNTGHTNVMAINFDGIQWNEVAGHKKITAYRVLQELMVNMKKHSRANLVAIKFKHENKKIIIQYSDNGTGMGNEKLNYKNGLQNAENRILAIDGTLTFDTSTGGLRINCTFPV